VSVVDALRLNGIAPVYSPIDRGQAREIADYLRASPCYVGHVKVYGDGIARSFDDIAAMTDVWCHDMETIVRAPYVWDLMISLLPTAARYLDTITPRLYSMNAFWTRPSDEPVRVDLQSWHRDKDDSRFLALFIYGTDVLNKYDGPHMFKEGTHVGTDDGTPRPIYGPAGTAFLADTRGLHMGMKPINRAPRLLVWARWGVSERPWSYDQDQLSPVDAALLGDRYPVDSATRDLVRLVAA
jgi:hypothetical protein